MMLRHSLLLRCRAPAVALLIISGGCTSTQVKPVPGLPPAEVARIDDAVPKPEPLSKSGNPAFYDALGKRYFVLPSAAGYEERGVASWYGPGFHEGATSSGERYDMYGMTAAHKTLPLPTYVEVTNLRNGHSIVVRVNDRGPFKSGRIIDLSYAAATKLDMLRDGTAFVEVKALVPGTSSSQTPQPAATMFVQAGAFGDMANADRLLHQLQNRGYMHAFIRDDQLKGKTLYRVRIGPINEVAEFDRVISDLKSLGIDNAHLALD
jgi:rare lipoprotein A